MGTNFHWITETNDPIDTNDPQIHIGKRSAAGLYCWDCDVMLVRGGNARIHHGGEMLKACPKCGAEPVKSNAFSEGPAAIELGFADARADRPTGVRGTSSFSWAQDPDEVRRKCEESGDVEVVEDEYGRRMSGLAFLRMLRSNCAVEFTHSIGRWFC